MNTVSVTARNGRQVSGAAVRSVFSEAYDSSSFGSIGTISRASANRLKGFIGYVEGGEGNEGTITPISTSAHARFIGDVVAEGISRLQATESSRLSIRTIVKNTALQRLTREVERSGASVEATMPANDSYSIVYIGYNTPQREISSLMRNNEAPITDRISSYRGDVAELASVASDLVRNSNDYSIRIVDGSARYFTAEEMRDISTLLATFGYNERESASSVTNEQNIIGLAYSSERIVGISITERRIIALSNGQRINIAELTDGTVSDSATGRNLYSAILFNVFTHISRNHQDLGLVYAESNTGSEALLRSALGWQNRQVAGVLHSHTRINDRPKDFLVTYLTRELMAQSTSRLLTAATEALRE